MLLPKGRPAPPSSRHTVTITSALTQKHTRHVFEGRFTPLRLVVNGRKGRRVIVVLGSDRKHYRVLDMDFKMKRTKGMGNEGDGDAEGKGSESESDEDEDDDEEQAGWGDGDVEMSGA